MAREKNVEKKMREHIESLGGLFLKLDACNHIGIPDRLAVLPGPRFLFVEVKYGKNTTSAIQDEVIEELQSMGCHAIVAYSVKELIQALKQL